MGRPHTEGVYGLQHQHTIHHWVLTILPDVWKECRLPVDVMFPTEKPAADVSYGEYAKMMSETMEKAFHTVREHVGDKQERQKQFYDKKCHGKPFQTGDLVFLHSTVVPRGQAKKPHHPWSGPWKVVKSLSEPVYRIQGRSGSKQRRMIVHFDRLKPCPKGTEFVTLNSKRTDNETNSKTKKPATSNNHQLHQYVAEMMMKLKLPLQDGIHRE